MEKHRFHHHHHHHHPSSSHHHPPSSSPPPPPLVPYYYSLFITLLTLASTLSTSIAWQTWTDESSIAENPGPRAGHSLLHWNNTVYLFGGRGNEEYTIHDPKTYQIGKVNGTLFFETYDQKHFKECFDEAGVGNNDKSSNITADQYAACYNILVGTYYNDVWEYNLNCTRYGDGPCQPELTEGWSRIGTNARLGGCRNYNESELCTHPHERWEHSAAILIVPFVPTTDSGSSGGSGSGSGGTTTPPTDDDPYNAPDATNTTANGTSSTTTTTTTGTTTTSTTSTDSTSSSNDNNNNNKKVEEAWLIVYGGFARMCEDYCSDMWAFPIASCQQNASKCVWKQIAALGRTGPSRRWRAASIHDETKWLMFGGHRLWHGFSQATTLANRWNNTEKFEYGGYLDDMWVYSLNPLGAGEDPFFSNRNDGVGHTIQFGKLPDGGVKDVVLGTPIKTQLGSWQQILPREACFRYPGQSWEERNDIICSITWPQPRASASIVLYGEHYAYLHGGFSAPFPYPHALGRGAGPGTGSLASDSKSPYPSYPYYLDDLWRFDFWSGVWREITPTGTYGIPLARRGHSIVVAGASLLLVGGYAQNVFFHDLWIYNITTNRWLEKNYFPHPLYPGNCTADVYMDPVTQLELPLIGSDGTPSLSVFGESTRGTAIDGLYGRADYDVFIQQARRQAPGWDGCRDRQDGREDLSAQLMYLRPGPRGGHAAVYSEVHHMMLLYGGETLFREELPLLRVTHKTRVIGDFWAWSRDSCPKNCSGVGDCWYGHCYCRDGYYGIDCSNATCPGTYCRYDTNDHIQQCQHCCSSPYNHTDEDVYVQDLRKTPCDAHHYGISHGICDGFGYCQCAPPFLTEDCSVRDCPNNCTGNGWCSVEYPVSRCMCNPPYTGNDCSSRVCLNNCSYPNGECSADGMCVCNGIKSPYNRTVFFDTYHGDDCSFWRPFAGATSQLRYLGFGLKGSFASISIFISSLMMIVILTVLQGL